MRRTLTLAVVIVLCCTAKPRADSVLLVVKSATIAKTKADGKAWDIGVGEKAWPDPYVKIWVYDADGGLADSGEHFHHFDASRPSGTTRRRPSPRAARSGSKCGTRI